MEDKVRTINALLFPFYLHHLPVFVLSFPFFFFFLIRCYRAENRKKEEDEAQHARQLQELA
jgi:hypothetical protein